MTAGHRVFLSVDDGAGFALPEGARVRDAGLDDVRAAWRPAFARRRDAVSEMSDRDRSVIVKIYVEEATPDEVAAEFGMSVKTVYTRTHRIRHALRRRIGPLAAA